MTVTADSGAAAEAQTSKAQSASGWALTQSRALKQFQPIHPVATGFLIGCAGLLLTLLRRPTALSNPGLFAEDGLVFLLQSLSDGASAVVEPYNGYIHLLPRLVAGLATLLPLSWTPLVFTLCSGLVAVSACSLLLSKRFEALIPSYAQRVLLFGLLLLIPRLTEVHLALNSTLWWCGVALLLTAVAGDPRTRMGRIAELLAVPVLVLSGLAGLVLAPTMAFRVARTRSLHSKILLGIWYVTALVQLCVYLTQDRRNGSVPIGTPLVRAGFEKVFGSLVLGAGSIDGRWASGVPAVLLVMLSLIAAAWAALVVLGLRWEFSAAVLYAAAATVTAGFLALGPFAAALPDRYTVLPIAAVLIGLVAAQPKVKALSILRLSLLILIVVMRCTDFVVPARPDTQWSRSALCLSIPANTCVIPLNPEGSKLTVPAGTR
jgi:hypothetical protein